MGAATVVPFVPIEASRWRTASRWHDTARSVAERSRCRCTSTRSVDQTARKNLEDIRRGEFEGLAGKMASDGWAPDFGPHASPKRRRIRESARDAAIAYNINLTPIASTSQENRGRRPLQQRGFRFSRRWA